MSRNMNVVKSIIGEVVTLVNPKQGIEFMVSKQDLSDILNFYWHVNTTGRVRTYFNKSHIFLHQYLMGTLDGFVIDHIDRNPLNNTRENLRFIKSRENILNSDFAENTSSKYHGIVFRKDKNVFQALIKVNGKSKNLGTFKSDFEAAFAYDSYVRDNFSYAGLVTNYSENRYSPEMLEQYSIKSIADIPSFKVTQLADRKNKYWGVSYYNNYWHAEVNSQGKKIFHKYFKSEEEAFVARSKFLDSNPQIKARR